jgi:hypothetical protein
MGIFTRQTSHEAAQQEIKRVAADLLRERLRYALKPSNRAERAKFTNMLKERIWKTESLLSLSEEAKIGKKEFLRYQCGMAVRTYKIKTLADVRALSVFTQLLMIVRELYGEDIAAEIPFSVAAEIVTEEILLHK